MSPETVNIVIEIQASQQNDDDEADIEELELRLAVLASLEKSTR